MKLNHGQIVGVRIYGGKVVKRRLVRVSAGVAVVTTQSEWETAAREGREPVCIGFPVADVTQSKRASPFPATP